MDWKTPKDQVAEESGSEWGLAMPSPELPVMQLWPAALGWQGLKGKERPFLSQ